MSTRELTANQPQGGDVKRGLASRSPTCPLLIGRGPEDERLRKLAEDLDIPVAPQIAAVDAPSAAA